MHHFSLLDIDPLAAALGGGELPVSQASDPRPLEAIVGLHPVTTEELAPYITTMKNETLPDNAKDRKKKKRLAHAARQPDLIL